MVIKKNAYYVRSAVLIPLQASPPSIIKATLQISTLISTGQDEERDAQRG